MRTIAVVVGAALLGAGALLWWNAARLLVVADPLPAHADAIVVMAGSVPDRALEAARLWRTGVAPRVVTAREQLPRGTAALRAAGVRLPEGHEQLRDALVGLGVPADAIRILGHRAHSTRSEALTIAHWACRTGVRSLVVVTSPYHTRRAALLLHRALGDGVMLSVQPARDAVFPTSRWWENRRAAKAVLSEWEKLLNYGLVERWAVRPCTPHRS